MKNFYRVDDRVLNLIKFFPLSNNHIHTYTNLYIKKRKEEESIQENAVSPTFENRSIRSVCGAATLNDCATPESVLSTQLNCAWAHWYEVDMTQYVHNLNPVDTAAI